MSDDEAGKKLVQVKVILDCGESGSILVILEVIPETTIGEVMIQALQQKNYPLKFLEPGNAWSRPVHAGKLLSRNSPISSLPNYPDDANFHLI